jgi:hypothetical protein
MGANLHEPPVPDSLQNVLTAAATYAYDLDVHGFSTSSGPMYPLLGQETGAAIVWTVDYPANGPTLPVCRLDQTAYNLLRVGTLATDGTNRFLSGGTYHALQARWTSLGLTAYAVAA